MLLLIGTTDKVQVITGSAGTIDVHASWMDNVAGSVVPGRTNTVITTAATTDVVPPPAAATQRNIKTLHIRNRGTINNDVTVVHTDGTIPVQLYKTTLVPNSTMQYIDEVGFGIVLGGSSPTPGGGFGGNSSSFTTGDAKITLKIVADPTWVMMNDGTIGSATSGANFPNITSQALFNLLFNNINDTNAPLQTNTGVATTRSAMVNAATAWAANCRMSLTKQLGRALCISGTGAGLSARNLGDTIGIETTTQTTDTLAQHIHPLAYVVDILGRQTYDTGIHLGFDPATPTWMNFGVSNWEGHSLPETNVQPSSFWNVMIKL